MSRERWTSRVVRLWAALVAMAIAVCAAPAAERGPPPHNMTMRLRVEWSAREPGVWNGRLKIDSGRFEKVRSLGEGVDDAGTIVVDEAGVAISRRSARTTDAFEITVSGRTDSRLTFELHDSQGENSDVELQFSLADCVHKPTAPAGAAGAPHVSIQRAPGDALEVSFERPHLVFVPGETLRLKLALNLLDLKEPGPKPVKAALKWQLWNPQHVVIADGSGSVPAILNGANPALAGIEIMFPPEEGEYHLHLSAKGRGFADVGRMVEFVVVGGQAPMRQRATRDAPKIVDSFEPASAGPRRKVPIAAPRQNSDGSHSRRFTWKRQHDEADRQEDPLESAVAYRLHVPHPGRPHLLEVTLPGPPKDELSIGLLQPEPHGKFIALVLVQPERPERLVPSGIDAIVPAGAVEDATRDSADARTFRQIVWPEDRESGIAIVGRSGGAPHVGRVQLQELGHQLPAHERERTDLSRRWVGQYLHKPDFARNLFGPKFYDPDAQRSRQTWRTFLVAGRRLVEYLRYRNHDLLVLAVLAEGAALYPSELVGSSARFDHGALTAAGHDPVQKDVLELLLRLFDREGLTLVPELQFDAPLEGIERLLREQPGDIKLVDGQGRSWDEASRRSRARESSDTIDRPNSHEFGYKGPGYNVLSPRVQETVLEIVRELLERSAAHPSLGGVAFELSLGSFLQLPGIEWGYDEGTIRRFEQAVQIRVPRGSGEQGTGEAYRFLTTTARRDWLRFRCAEVARFHARLAELVLAARPDARVVFSSPLGLAGGPDFETAAIAFVRSGGGPTQFLAARGLDFLQPPYSNDQRISVLRPVVHDALADRAARGALATLNNSPAIDALFRGGTPGAILFSTGTQSRGGDPAAIAVFSSGPEHTETAPRESSWQPFAHALATLDARIILEGGDALFLAPVEAGQDYAAALARLPDVPFRPVAFSVQPLVVRSARVANSTFLYAINDSPLRLSAVLSLADCPAATTTCQRLTSGEPVALTSSSDGTGCSLRVDLPAYGLFECRFGRPAVRVADLRVSFPDESLVAVKDRIERLSRRMGALSEAARRAGQGLKNSGFEIAGSQNEPLPGWKLAVEKAGWSLDPENPRSGQRSLRLSGDAGEARLGSPELSLDGSRFVAVSVWMRSNKSAARVEIALDAQLGGEPFRRDALVTVGKNWAQYRFGVDDFPPGEITQARIFVRPVDSCKLWIDDAEIDAQSFNADELRQLTKTLSSVKLAFDEGRYADCQRLLDGYWGSLLASEPIAPASPSATRPRMGERVKTLFRR